MLCYEAGSIPLPPFETCSSVGTCYFQSKNPLQSTHLGSRPGPDFCLDFVMQASMHSFTLQRLCPEPYLDLEIVMASVLVLQPKSFLLQCRGHQSWAAASCHPFPTPRPNSNPQETTYLSSYSLWSHRLVLLLMLLSVAVSLPRDPLLHRPNKAHFSTARVSGRAR